ncbi:hypothetical protein [Gallaecimonas xiamenensis]|uniref:Lipoprotein n=1 Tax=Gallaecimonas xiamenensis 3-C-1 TaxID=745411 RepID=K2ITZ7_9GAMM|nr:hypothetical protein [Gallaecimonas xiamenensis]EKE73711.1 hypothetical protein B3C1_09947 [Gallaecimonas xiamenensis 3-C-1]
MKNKILCLLTCLLLLGCQSTKRQALAPEHNATLDNSVIIQDQGAILLGARFDADISQSEAIQTLGPVQAELQRFMFQTSFKHKLRKAFWDHEQLHNNRIIEVDNSGELDNLFAIRGVDGRNVLKVIPSYSLSSDRRHLQVSLLAEYYAPPRKNLYGKEERQQLLYRNSFYYQSPALAFEPRLNRNASELAAERQAIEQKYYALLDRTTDGYNRLQLVKEKERELKAVDSRQDQADISRQYADFLLGQQDWLIAQANQGMSEVIEMMLYDLDAPALPDMNEDSRFPAAPGRHWQRLGKREGRNLVSTAQGESFDWGELAQD